VRHVAALAARHAPVLAEDAVAALAAYDWPGNVRELENCIARAVVAATGDVIRAQHIVLGRTAAGDDEAPTPLTLDDAERAHLAAVLRATNGHKTRAAELLDISRPRLDRLIDKHGLADLAPGRDTSAD
jgi:two-component system, NtrC family, response regulator